jgi:hypothetical protein
MFLKAKRLMMGGGSMDETLTAINKAIEIQEDIESANTKKSAQLGRYLYFQGTVYHG